MLKFKGRPDDLSPKARLKLLLGWPKPFDRHDWVIDRDGTGKDLVRYVIDYYYDDELADHDKLPALHSQNAVKSISMDARPAVDSVGAVVDRLTQFPGRMLQAWHDWRTPPLERPEDPATSNPVGEAPKEFTVMQKVQAKCAPLHAALSQCEDEESCGQVQLALNVCIAKVACEDRATKFMERLEKGDELGSAYGEIAECLDHFRDEHGNL